jgi:hypothetical protein
MFEPKENARNRSGRFVLDVRQTARLIHMLDKKRISKSRQAKKNIKRDIERNTKGRIRSWHVLHW